jgi:DNA ligase-1
MSKMFKPHLATDADANTLLFPLWVQYKIDGVRMLVRDTVATGRSMKKYKNLKMTEYFSKPCFEGFDMEVGVTSPNDPDLCRLTTSLVNTIKGGLPKFVVVFDYLTPDNLENGVGYKSRMDKLKDHLLGFPEDEEVELIFSQQYLMSSLEELEAFYAEALTLNYEGVIIRKQDGVHKSGRATVKEGNYLRMKPTGDSEGIVLRLEEAYENLNEAKVNELGHTERSTHKANMVPKGMIGAMWLKDIHSDEEVKVGAGKLNHEQRKLYFEQPQLILGDLVKYAFLATGKKDAPRHPRYISHRAWEDISK